MSRYSVIGLTGGIGSGKSTVARMFGALGVHWVDADDVARQVVEPGTQALRAIADHSAKPFFRVTANWTVLPCARKYLRIRNNDAGWKACCIPLSARN